MRISQRGVKYTIDRLMAVLLLLILSPIWALIAFAIILDDHGPVFFTQERCGLNGALFKIWKFRTMVVNADQFLDSRGSVNGQDRITRVGKLLRLTSLDELPQLINIVRGEMSFVGPRPALPIHLFRYTKQQRRRFAMKPGVTGMSQIKGRNMLLWSKRIEYDIWYIDHYSLWLDLKILIKTVKVVLLREGVVLDRNPGQVDDLAPLPEEFKKQA